jgi:F-type H+-transporting ATPase subunit delta
VNVLIQDSEVADRYAKAAFGLAIDRSALEAVHKDLASLKAALRESDDLRKVLGSALLSSESKHKGLMAVVASAKFHAITQNLLGVLAHNNRLSQTLAVINAFNRRYDAHKGVVAVEVTSAVPLSGAQLDGLTDALNQALGQKSDINTRVDEDILGGLKVRVGSRLFDASLKTKLDSLKFALKRA